MVPKGKEQKNSATVLSRTIIFVLIISILMQISMLDAVYAAPNPSQPEPEMLRIEALEEEYPPIGYNEYDGNYADLKWSSVDRPDPDIADGVFINMYLQEVAKPYMPSKPVQRVEENMPGDRTSLRLKNLESGTVYYSYARAYYTSEQYTSPESIPSNSVKFLTDIELSATSVGSNQINIVWDDVWNNGQRIDYKLYISEESTFANTPPIYIGREYIGANGPVVPDESSGKLEYTYNVSDPGRVYYIKIAPDISETQLKKSEYSNTVSVSSKILARLTKMSTTSFGTIWRMDWSPVITGLSTENIELTYNIYKGQTDSGDVPQYVASVDDTSFFITVGPGEENTYYLITALITKNGYDVYPGIRIESDRILIKESDIPAAPSMPELTESFINSSGDIVIEYSEELSAESASMLWRLPRDGSGEIDTNVLYDMWLITDPSHIDAPPDSTRIASSLRISEENHVLDEGKILGYKYVLDGLEPNTTYYFKIVAKKTYVEYIDDILQSVTYTSQPALKVVITPAEGQIERPIVPGTPPLQIKEFPSTSGKYMITEDTAVIQMKNKWYEQYNHATSVWEYRTAEDLGDTIVNNLETGVDETVWPEKPDYRIVEYDSGVTIDVGMIPYEDTITYNDLASIPADKVTGFPTAANDPDEDPVENPDGEAHNIDIILSDLEPNTTYVVWIRASRVSAGVISGPSDPILVTTHPVIHTPLEKPTVPVFNYYWAGDKYIDLGWNFNPTYNYYIKYGEEDDINTSYGEVKINPEDLFFKSSYRIEELESDTLYYFWIQAEAVGPDGDTNRSVWSDAYLVKTKQDIPPDTPIGFGVKNDRDAVTKDSITYEWLTEEGLEYILEIADNPDYLNSTEYEVGTETEYTVGELRSNYRYYARLYAYDPERELRSAPTLSVGVRTKSSNDDYDSDQDVEHPVEGNFVVKHPVIVNRTWNISITGINAERFVQYVQNDGLLDYTIDLSSPPSKVDKLSLQISNKVFDGLDRLRENLIIKTKNLDIVIRPGVLSRESTGIKVQGEFDYNIIIDMSTKGYNEKESNISFKSDITEITLSVGNKFSEVPVSNLEKPIKIVYRYDDESWYKFGNTSAYFSKQTTEMWDRIDSRAIYYRGRAEGNLSFDITSTGCFVVAERGNDYFDDIGRHWTGSSIEKVASVHDIKSIKGRVFEPDRRATYGDAVMFMLDILDYNYSIDYMLTAAKSGIISMNNLNMISEGCTRENVIAMAVRVYELKIGEKAQAAPDFNCTTVFDDMDDVSPLLLARIRFAVENGIVISRFKKILGPKDIVSRGEIMVLLEKVLAFSGEIN